MNAKRKTLVYLLIAVMLMLQIILVAAQDETPPIVEITLSDNPSNDDENWPIIKKETHKRKDPSSGNDIVETIVVRQEPPNKDKIACKEKHGNKDKLENKMAQTVLAAATCVVNRYSVTIQSQVSVGGGFVTGYVKNIAMSTVAV